jgi:hypothetical protein
MQIIYVHPVSLSQILALVKPVITYIEHSLKVLPRYWRLLSSKLSLTNIKPYTNQYIINDICRMDLDNARKKNSRLVQGRNTQQRIYIWRFVMVTLF